MRRFLVFSAKDNGIGIDPEYNEKIFSIFKRLQHDHKYSGTGIGLAVSSALSNVMADESGLNPNQARDPLSTSPSPGTPSPSASRRLNLLLAEDNLPDALLVREAIRMENLPVEVHMAHDGQEAIDFISRADEDPSAPCPQLLILDLNLPKRDGFEVLRRFRASTKCKGVPVLVITSSDSPTDRSQASALGAGYFRKPPSYEEFLKLGGVLQQILKNSGLL